VAPFAGVVTSRYADTGALIAAGIPAARNPCRSSGWHKFQSYVSFFPIPESVAAQIHLGDR